MLDCSVLFFALSLVASLLGFTGLAVSAAALAEILLYTLISTVGLGLVGALLGGGMP